MVPPDGFASGSIGSLSYRPSPDKSLIAITLDFILAQLPSWRSDPQRPNDSNENQMNSSLCDFLDTRSRTDFPMVRFKHQEPQKSTHSVDMGVHGVESITYVNTRAFSIYQPFLAIEAKRLPAPTRDREQEYVAGTKKPSGAIERFRLGLHGANVDNAVIVGYIESETPAHWYSAINDWVGAIARGPTTRDCKWSEADALRGLVVDEERGTSSCDSNHARNATCCTAMIRIRHLWVVMNERCE